MLRRILTQTSFLLLAVLLMISSAALTAVVNEEAVGSKPVVLIKGLDGGDYEPYSPALIKQVQEALRAEGLYSGEVTGLLDQATMEAVGGFQKKNGLQVSGVPSPQTRKRLLNGS